MCDYVKLDIRRLMLSLVYPIAGIEEEEEQETEALPLSKKQRKGEPSGEGDAWRIEPCAYIPRPTVVLSAVQKLLDFSQYRHRHIALEVLYIGWKYHGFASQPGETDTVEVSSTDQCKTKAGI